MKRIYKTCLAVLMMFVLASFFLFCNADVPEKPEKEPDELEGVEKIDMVEIEAGEFEQTHKDGSFTHVLTKSFEIGKYEVTYELWYIVYTWAKENGYKFQNAGMEGSDVGGGYFPDYDNIGKEPTDGGKISPVTMISWRDAIVWCNAYSELKGYNPVYKCGEVAIKSSVGKMVGKKLECPLCDAAEIDPDADGFRLPTEGQWQYVASNKGQTPFNYASGAKDKHTNDEETGKVAWYSKNSGPNGGPGDDTWSVGKKTANELGIHDMSGNVWEWCWDWCGDYPTDKETDYEGADVGDHRVCKGGGACNDSKYLQIGNRGESFEPSNIGQYSGFRVVRIPN